MKITAEDWIKNQKQAIKDPEWKKGFAAALKIIAKHLQENPEFGQKSGDSNDAWHLLCNADTTNMLWNSYPKKPIEFVSGFSAARVTISDLMFKARKTNASNKTPT